MRDWRDVELSFFSNELVFFMSIVCSSMSREQPYRGNFPTFTRSPGDGNGSPKPDPGNGYYNTRGGYNPRRARGRGGFGGFPARTTGPNVPPEANIKDGLDTSRIIEMIVAPARLSAPEHIPIEDAQYVASYNWVDKEDPTIVVPGTSLPPFSRSPTRPANHRINIPHRFAGFVDRARPP